MEPWKVVLLSLVLIILNWLNLIKQVLQPVFRLLLGSRIPVVVRTPEDRFKDLQAVGYSFSSNYIHLLNGKLPRVHYLDEGPRDGPVILCLHGEPTWSFLYRNMIPSLVQAGYRVIVPDFIGFGKSDKYTAPGNYSHELHTLTIKLIMDELGLQDITLVCQDWGGLTGLSVVKDCPSLFSSLVIMNTGLPAPVLDFSDTQADPQKKPVGVLQRLVKALPFLLWRSSVQLLGTSLPLSTLFSIAFRKFKLSPSIIAGYSAPHPTPLYSGGVAAWPLLVPLFIDDAVTPHMWEARNCLKTWKKPVLVMFSDSDPITRGQEKLFLNLVPTAKEVKIRGAGHFLQETHGEELSENILRFLQSKVHGISYN